ncbi:MAG TPA: kynureninase, partial [Gammaproteobacteria bacterium]|nr:kynureninase [Gammaproteobacteria bacterium]
MTTTSLETLSNSQSPGLLDARRQDELDPLSNIGDLFDLPPDLVYLDGNSLGAMPAVVPEKIQEAVTQGWRTELIRSWNDRGWHILPLTLGNRLAPLMGANAGEVLVVDSTSINLFKTLSAALKMRPGRTEIVSERYNFPSDLHIIQGAITHFYPQHKLVEGKESDESILELIGPSTAVVTLTQVSYRTGLIRDMA